MSNLVNLVIVILGLMFDVGSFEAKNRVFNRCTSILTKLSYQFLDWPKVVPWLVLWKNGFRFEVALKLWSRRAAQFYLVIYSSKMKILHIFAF